MRIPNLSLSDYKAATQKKAEPPEPVTLEFTGETEVLKPLAYWDGPVRRTSTIVYLYRRLTWFHRSLAMGGAMTVISFLLGTGIYLALYGLPVDPELGIDEVAMNRPIVETLTPNDEQSTPDLVAADVPSAFDEVNAASPAARRTAARPRLTRVAFRPRSFASQRIRPPQLWVSQFIPTRMIIYVENGEVRSRIEPWLTASYHRPTMLPN